MCYENVKASLEQDDESFSAQTNEILNKFHALQEECEQLKEENSRFQRLAHSHDRDPEIPSLRTQTASDSTHEGSKHSGQVNAIQCVVLVSCNNDVGLYTHR